MADGDDQVPASPPLPKRGTYNIDFDALDETTNPFEPKLKLDSSSTIRSGLTASTVSGADDGIDPFKPRATLASSPPGSPKVAKSPNNNNIGDDGIHADTEDSPVGRVIQSTPGSTDDVLSTDVKQSTPVTTKTKKKIVKKTKAVSKLKAPKSLKQGEDSKSDSPVPNLDDNVSFTGSQEIVETVPTPLSKKQSLPRKKVKSHDSGSSSVKEDILSQSQVGKSEEDEKKAVHVQDEDVPCDAASEAMASSSEIDHHFVEHDDFEVPKVGSDKTWSAKKVADGSSELTVLNKSYDGVENKISGQGKSHAPMSKSESLVKSSKETSAQHSSSPSPEGVKLSRSRDELPVVNTPTQGGRTTKHPATRALEAGQADITLKVLENKNESSSEDAPFYDAYEYPPVATSNAKLGQKASTEMERDPDHDDGGDNKGTVVQLVQDVGTTKVLRYSQSDWNKMKQDMELNFQASLLNKERDWSMMLAERDKKITSLEEVNRKVKHTNEDMRMIVAEFEKTISQLQAEKDKTKSDSHKIAHGLENERDQAIEDLQSVETAFSDLHRRYEKSKSIIEGFKRNEEQLKQCVEEFQGKLKKSDMKLQALRSQAEEKLDKANEDIEKIRKSTKSDLIRLEAALKKAELRISSLEESLLRKEKENQELTAICDELISKVGS